MTEIQNKIIKTEYFDLVRYLAYKNVTQRNEFNEPLLDKFGKPTGRLKFAFEITEERFNALSAEMTSDDKFWDFQSMQTRMNRNKNDYKMIVFEPCPHCKQFVNIKEWNYCPHCCYQLNNSK